MCDQCSTSNENKSPVEMIRSATGALELPLSNSKVAKPAVVTPAPRDQMRHTSPETAPCPDQQLQCSVVGDVTDGTPPTPAPSLLEARYRCIAEGQGPGSHETSDAAMLEAHPGDDDELSFSHVDGGLEKVKTLRSNTVEFWQEDVITGHGTLGRTADGRWYYWEDFGDDDDFEGWMRRTFMQMICDLWTTRPKEDPGILSILDRLGLLRLDLDAVEAAERRIAGDGNNAILK